MADFNNDNRLLDNWAGNVNDKLENLERATANTSDLKMETGTIPLRLFTNTDVEVPITIAEASYAKTKNQIIINVICHALKTNMQTLEFSYLYFDGLPFKPKTTQCAALTKTLFNADMYTNHFKFFSTPSVV